MSKALQWVVIAMAATGLGLAGAPDTESTRIGEMIWAQENAYIEHLAAGELEEVEGYWHEKFIGWPAHAELPISREQGRPSLEAYLSGIEIVSVEIQPQAMTLLDEVAVVHYFVVLETKKQGEEPVRSQIRITHTWLKTPEGWKIIGGMSSG